MYGYIYKTTNLVNGKIYIGQHKKDKFDNNYIGSGIYLTRAINKYGFENFFCEIIDKCSSQNELNEKEIYWIEYYNSRNPKIGYNLHKGGLGGIGGSVKGRKLSEKTKKKMSIARSGAGNPCYGKPCSEIRRKHISEARKGHKWSEESKRKASITHKNIPHPKGYKISKEICEKRKGKLKNRKWITNGVKNKLIKIEELDKYLKLNYKLGLTTNRKEWHWPEELKYKLRKPKSEEHKRKLSEVKKKSGSWKGNYFGYPNKEAYMAAHNGETYHTSPEIKLKISNSMKGIPKKERGKNK